LRNVFKHRVFYFKSCSARHLYPASTAPETLLRNTRGLDLIEDTEGEHSCCGANGRFAMLNPEAAEKMTGEIVQRAYNQGAEFITSTDIHCLQLMDAFKQQHDVDVDIIHIADILRGEE
jgi:L-lactate dehydrogenase complex protein LldE